VLIGGDLSSRCSRLVSHYLSVEIPTSRGKKFRGARVDEIRGNRLKVGIMRDDMDQSALEAERSSKVNPVH
jgi:hypothetical protein